VQAESFKSQILSLRTDLLTAQASLRRERSINAAIEAGAMNNSDYLTSELLKARAETEVISVEYAACCAEIEALREELGTARLVARKAFEAKEDETMAALEASAVATSASLRRAELQVEADEMLQELIGSKLHCAELSSRLLEERKRYFGMRKRLQRYAQTLNQLEITALTTTTTTARSNEEVDGEGEGTVADKQQQEEQATTNGSRGTKQPQEKKAVPVKLVRASSDEVEKVEEAVIYNGEEIMINAAYLN
jgi:hypothetical protein